VALVFFAGHGATFGDVPYVVPVDAQFSSLGEMPYELVQVETLIGELRRAKGLRIAILDACRDNSAERELKQVAAVRGGGEITRGLARVKNPEGLILAYATQYMSTAADGPPNGDSPFTTALLNNIATPGLDVKDLFFKVGRDVIASTMGRQRPEVSVSFYDPYALVPAGPGAAVTPPMVPPPPDPAAQAWAAVRDSTSVAVFEDFIRRFGDSIYGTLARARLEQLKQSGLAAIAPAKPAPDQSQHVPDTAKPTHGAETYRSLNLIGDVFEALRKPKGGIADAALATAAITDMLGEFPSPANRSYVSDTLANVPKRGTYGLLVMIGDVFEHLREPPTAENDKRLTQAALNGMLKLAPASKALLDDLDKVGKSWPSHRQTVENGRIKIVIE
jgi:hypothetical protein